MNTATVYFFNDIVLNDAKQRPKEKQQVTAILPTLTKATIPAV